MFSTINRVNEKINSILINLSSVLLFSAMLVTAFLVFTRYFFKFSFSWAEEFTKYSVVYLTLLSGAAVMRKKEHIAVTYFLDKMPTSIKKILSVSYTVLCIAVMLVWIVVGMRTAIFMKLVFSGGIRLTMFWPYLAIPISGVFFLISLILNLYEEFVPSATHD